ncbi:hypothetical protein TD95_003774, partial [Thielaviopsis punctulata]
MDVICQCGTVKFTTPLPKPLALYVCHCMQCKRTASAAVNSSAIYPRFAVPVLPALSVYKYARNTRFVSYFCKECGTRLIHITPSKNVVSIKAACIIGLDWSSAVHLSTLCSMLPISEGSEATVESPEQTGTAAPAGGDIK